MVRLQPDIVKLDKDVVQALPDRVSSAVVAAIVQITHAYGGLVLAECVETAEQAAAADDLGVDLGQGWFFGRPEARTPRRAATVPEPRASGSIDPSLPDAAVALHVTGQGPRPRTAAEGSAPGLSGLLVRAVDESFGGVVVVDVLAPDAPMLYVNPAFERMTGYQTAELLGRNCRLLQGPDTDPAAVRELAEATLGQEHRTVLRNYRKDGSGWWNELHLSPVRDRTFRLTHLPGVAARRHRAG